MIRDLCILAVASFIQNMSFTWVSRSRNSGDVFYHYFVAIASNGIWFICNMFILKTVWKPLTEGSLGIIFWVGIVYVIATSLGSAVMMAILLKTEKGKKRVGAV